MKKETILIVDDQEVNRYLLAQIFKDDYDIIEAENGLEALKKLEQNKGRIVVILLDIFMPTVDGFTVLNQMNAKGYIRFIPVVMITGDTSSEVEEKGFDQGVSDFIVKPFNPVIVKKRVQNVIDLYMHKNCLEILVKRQTEKIELQASKMREINNQLIDTLSSVVEFRDVESGEHIKRIKGLTRILAESVAKLHPEYGLNDTKIAKITLASAMHDIGKIAIPDDILLKPGKLDRDEFDVMKSHTTKGCKILEQLNFIEDQEFYRDCYEICRYHHEKFDGNGYPDNLKGDDIPISAQIVSVADAYDALVSERVYKEAYSTQRAYDMILHGECGMFNPKIMECFKMVREEFENFTNTFAE